MSLSMMPAYRRETRWTASVTAGGRGKGARGRLRQKRPCWKPCQSLSQPTIRRRAGRGEEDCVQSKGLSSVRFSFSPHSPSPVPFHSPAARPPPRSSWPFQRRSDRKETAGGNRPSRQVDSSSKFPWCVGQKGMPPHHHHNTVPSPHPPDQTESQRGNPSIGNSSSRAGRWWWWSRNVAIPFFSRASRYPSPCSLAHRGRGHGKVGVLGMGWETTTPPARPHRWPCLCSALRE